MVCAAMQMMERSKKQRQQQAGARRESPLTNAALLQADTGAWVRVCR